MDHEDIAAEYHVLLQTDVFRLIPGVPTSEETGTPEINYPKLLAYASAFALSDVDADRRLAYDIAVRTAQLAGQQNVGVAKASEHILSRLGNFPGRDLLRERLPSIQRNRCSPIFELEASAREAENTLPQINRTLTDFQCAFFDRTEQMKLVSVSAPTSAGKSFVLTLDILRRLTGAVRQIIVYVVPTRALIRQVSMRLSRSLRTARLNEVSVLTAPVALNEERSRRGAIYVLTQERLQVLLQLPDEDLPNLHHLVVDEAHGLAEGARGIVLHGAIDEALYRFPEATVTFASPLIANPSYMVDLFRKGRDSYSETSNVPTVTQNVILVNRVKRKPEHWTFEVLDGDVLIPIAERRLDIPKEATLFERRAAFAQSITHEGESTIVYANRPIDAEKTAQELARLVGYANDLEDELEELCQFVSEQVHPEYQLHELLRSRVAFHHGQMPAMVRSRIEDLLEQGIIKFVCCTSTLLQGVNLPAKHIVLEKPTRGTGQPLERSEFRNLAGRAGRLTYEFQGNVWCLDSSKWEEASYLGQALQEVTASYDHVLSTDPLLVSRAFNNQLSREEKEVGIAVATKAFLDLRINDRPIDRNVSENLQHGLDVARAASNEVVTQLPDELFRKQPGILPNRLNDLYRVLLAHGDIRNCIPSHPKTQGARDRLFEVFRLCHSCLEGETTNSYRHHARIANSWVKEFTLREIIERYYVPRTKDDKGTSIRSIVSLVEHELHHTYARNVRAYCAVLEVVLIARGMQSSVESIAPLYRYLECGASDHSVLTFMDLGLSRHTALALYRNGTRVRNDSSLSEVLDLLSTLDLEKVRIPALCKAEIQSLTNVGVSNTA